MWRAAWARLDCGAMTSPQFAEPQQSVPPTRTAEVDAKVDRLASKKGDWLKVGIPERISYLRQCIDGVLAVADAWVADGCRAKGIAEGDSLVGEEWVVGPWQRMALSCGPVIPVENPPRRIKDLKETVILEVCDIVVVLG